MQKNSLLKNFFSSGFYEKDWGWQINEKDSMELAEDVVKLLKLDRGHLLDWCGGWRAGWSASSISRRWMSPVPTSAARRRCGRGRR